MSAGWGEPHSGGPIIGVDYASEPDRTVYTFAGRRPDERGRSGVWMVYGWDLHPYDVTPFVHEIDARRHADSVGAEFMNVTFVPYGRTLEETLREHLREKSDPAREASR